MRDFRAGGGHTPTLLGAVISVNPTLSWVGVFFLGWICTVYSTIEYMSSDIWRKLVLWTWCKLTHRITFKQLNFHLFQNHFQTQKRLTIVKWHRSHPRLKNPTPYKRATTQCKLCNNTIFTHHSASNWNPPAESGSTCRTNQPIRVQRLVLVFLAKRVIQLRFCCPSGGVEGYKNITPVRM